MSEPTLKAFDHAGKYVVGYVNAQECLEYLRSERRSLIRTLKELTLWPSCRCENYDYDEECMSCIRQREARALLAKLTQPTKKEEA